MMCGVGVGELDIIVIGERVNAYHSPIVWSLIVIIIGNARRFASSENEQEERRNRKN